MIWRCKECGMLTVGVNPPEECAVCGAKSKEFVKVEQVESVQGTETKKNLEKAFSGESQANRRYLLFTQLARLEGNKEAEEMFLNFSYEETWHALSHLLYLQGGANKTAENLRESIAGETYESEKMYKEFSQKAKDEGFDNIALIFDWLSKIEGEHALYFSKLLDKMEQS